MRLITIIFFFVTITTILKAQTSSDDIIKRSIVYHDPTNQLSDQKATFHFTETRPNGADRKSKISLYPKKEQFEMSRQSNGVTVITKGKKGSYTYTLDGKSPNEEEIEKYRLNKSRSQSMQNYYHYLWYMPMKLNDPGTIIADEATIKDFFGKQALEIKVTYDPSVGSDIWYFYFDPTSYALIGYRFYHDEAANDGEYIILEGETQYKNVRIPKSRTWYTHKEDKLLGTDILTKLSIE